jgi:tRNA (guanine-N7-)-methyltransferase
MAPAAALQVSWREIFGADRPLRIEIGFGKSEFLIDVALREPGYNYLGFEYSRKRVENFLRKVHRRGAANIRVICMNAVEALDRAFEPGSVDRFYILFPDPWPKRRHAKHRFVKERNIERLARLLRPGGGISLRTDDPAYAEEMRAALEAHPALGNLAGAGNFAGAPRDPIPTIYQAKFEKAGRRTFFLEFIRRKEE